MQKPPLYYWLVAFFGWLRGGAVDTWCVRLPAALAALGCVGLLLAWSMLVGRPLAGGLAGAMLATALHFTALARTGRIDMPLTFSIALALIAFSQGRRIREQAGCRAGWCWLLVGYLAVAAGVMLKGPIAVVLPLAVGCLWWIVAHRTDAVAHLARLSPGWGVPLVLTLTLPWFLWANWQTDGEWFRVFIWYHNVERGLGPDDRLRAFPVWYYGPQLLFDLLPWTLLLPLAAWHVYRNRADKDARYGAVWLVAMLLLLSCMRFKRADYLLPAFPGAAWMLGCAAERWYRRRQSARVLAAFAGALGMIVLAWLAYLNLVVPAIDQSRTYRAFAEEVRRHSKGNIIFFRAEAHNVAFLVGPPLHTVLEWENLDVWAGKEQSAFVVMPAECAEEWRSFLKCGTLEIVTRSEDLLSATARTSPIVSLLQRLDSSAVDTHERPLVLVRTRCLPKS
jgi:4-amino-4-deoxy-L-arabinose transferase-like glycosyltransferase